MGGRVCCLLAPALGLSMQRPSIFSDDDDVPLSSHSAARPRVVPAPLLDAHAASQLEAVKSAGLLDFDSYLEASGSSTSGSSSGSTLGQRAMGLGGTVSGASLSGGGGGGGTELFPARSTSAPQSQYIAAMVQKAAEKKRIQDAVIERRLAKEQEAEEAQYGPKERFVTSSYASVKEARKVAQEEEAKQAAEEASALASKRGLTGLYRNVLFAGAGGTMEPQGSASSVPLVNAPQQPLAEATAPVPHQKLSQQQYSATLVEQPTTSSSSSSSLPSASASVTLAQQMRRAAGFQGSSPEEVEKARAQAQARYEARKAAGLL